MSTSASATPVTDGEHVFAYFGSHLAKIDLAGTLLWTREIDPEYLARSRYGAASSLQAPLTYMTACPGTPPCPAVLERNWLTAQSST